MLNLVFTLLVPRTSPIGGHVGGLIGGVVLMYALLRVGESARRSALVTAGVIAASVVIAYAKVRGYQ